jgi:hypothetical protein
MQAFGLVRQKNKLDAKNDTGFILDDNNEMANNLGINFKNIDSNIDMGQD